MPICLPLSDAFDFSQAALMQPDNQALDNELGIRIGKRIASNRKRLRWTQEDLAERLEIEIMTVSRFERGVSIPSLRTLDRIAQLQGVSLASMFEVETTPIDGSEQLLQALTQLTLADRNFVIDQALSSCAFLRDKQ